MKSPASGTPGLSRPALWGAAGAVVLILLVGVLFSRSPRPAGAAKPFPPFNSKNQSGSASPAKEPPSPSASPEAVVPPVAASEVEKEIPTGDARLKKFVDNQGNLTREVRQDLQGNPVSETTYADGKKTTVQKFFSTDGTLLRVRKYENDRLVDSQDFR
jgi:hypothetical protein